MREERTRRSIASCVVGLACLALPACRSEAPAPDKVPITTASEEARDLFLQGRDLFEKLRATDAREYYQRAVELDPEFALAHLAMANTSPSANEFWRSLETAVAAAAKVSEGERHLILAADAGARGDVAGQKEHLLRLAEAHPGDERVHNAVGQYYFARQEWGTAIEHYERATAIDPEFSAPYNQLGYAHRFLEQYDEAEEAFKAYIRLIADEPNPYDSYAELLMKLGRHEESIGNYEAALERNPNFVPSYVGIGNNQVFMDQGDQARETFGKLLGVARNDGERRQALLWTASSYVHEGNTAQALSVLQERYGIAEASADFPAMAGDLVLMGNVLLEAGSPDEALDRYLRAIEMMDKSAAPQDNKENFGRNHLYREARVALAKGDLQTAEEKASLYGERVQERRIPFEIWQHHELLGMIAMQAGDHEAALEHLSQANQQNPRVLFLTALALDGKGDRAAALEMCERVANFNGLNFNYAYVRGPAREMLARG